MELMVNIAAAHRSQDKVTCPYCGAECDANFVDVGVGMVQVSPYHCDNCHAYQIGPYDVPERPLTDAEKSTGWYEPYDG